MATSDLTKPAMNALESALLQTTRIPVSVQALFLSMPAYAPTMIDNHDLDYSLLATLLAKKNSAAIARQLVSRPMPLELVLKTLRRERRAGPLFWLLQHNPPATPEVLHAYANQMRNPDQLATLYSRVKADSALADALGPYMGATERLMWLTHSEDPAPEDIKKMLEDLQVTYRYPVDLDSALVVFFDLHPVALEIAVTQVKRHDINVAAAKSINLTDELAAALMGVSVSGLKRPVSTPPDTTIAYYLVRNLVSSPRVLSYLARAYTNESVTSRSVAKRKSWITAKIEPGFTGLDREATRVLTDQMCRASTLSSPGGAFAPNRLHWAALLLEKTQPGMLSEAFIHRVLSSMVRLKIGPHHHAAMIAQARRHGYEYEVPSPRNATPVTPPALDQPIRARVLSYVASRYVNDTTPFAAAHLGQALIERFAADTNKWQLFAELSINSGDSTVRDLIGVVERLTQKR